VADRGKLRAVLALIFPLLVAAAAELPLVDPGPQPLVSVLTARLRASGMPIVAVEQAGIPWAVVQLHVRTGTIERTPEEARAMWAYAVSLADGRLAPPKDVSAKDDVAQAGGETRVALDVDGFVVSDGVPAGALDIALRAVEKRIVRRRKLVVPAAPAARLDVAPREIPLAARQLFGAGHAAAFPLDETASPAPELLTALVDKTLRRDDVVLVVVGAEAPEKLIARAERAIRTVLPVGRGTTTPLSPLTGTRSVLGAEIAMQNAVHGAEVGAVYIPLQAPPRSDAADVDDGLRARAAERVLAELAGVAYEERAAFALLSVVVRTPLDPRPGTDALETTALAPIAALARGPVDEDVLKRAKRRAKTALLRSFTTPEGAAFVVGKAALHGGDAQIFVRSVDAVDGVTADDVVVAAAGALTAGRVVATGVEVSTWR
jgi:hypothetical protein